MAADRLPRARPLERGCAAGIHPRGAAIKLICPSCFVAPAPGTEGANRDASDMLVCTAAQAGYAALASLAGAPALRCDYCGGKVQLDRYHLGWYGY